MLRDHIVAMPPRPRIDGTARLPLLGETGGTRPHPTHLEQEGRHRTEVDLARWGKWSGNWGKRSRTTLNRLPKGTREREACYLELDVASPKTAEVDGFPGIIVRPYYR